MNVMYCPQCKEPMDGPIMVERIPGTIGDEVVYSSNVHYECMTCPDIFEVVINGPMKVRVITLNNTPEQQMRHIESTIENRLDALSNCDHEYDEECAALFNFLCDLGVTGYEQP